MACKRRLLRQPFISPFTRLWISAASQPVGKENLKLRMNLTRYLRLPVRLLVMSALAEQAVIVRKYRPVFWDLPQLHVKIFNGIHGVNQPSYRLLYIRLSLRFCPHSGHCKDLFFNIPAYWCCVFSDALRFKFGFSGSRNGRFHFAHTCFNGLYAMTVSAVIGVFIPVIVLGIADSPYKDDKWE